MTLANPCDQEGEERRPGNLFPGLFSLAIETSSRVGSVALGRGDAMLEARPLPEGRRHNVELMLGIAGLCEAHGIGRGELAEVYVSLGPGGFTGLRVGLATAKMLAVTLGARVVGVPTLDSVAQNVTDLRDLERVVVCLNEKAGRAWSAVYQRTQRGGETWFERVGDAALRTLEECVAALAVDVESSYALLGDPLPAGDASGVRVLEAGLAVPRAWATWAVGRAMAARGAFADAATLVPIYAREPEAVRLWLQSHQEPRTK